MIRHAFVLRAYKMNRKTTLLIAQVAVVILLLVLSDSLPAAAQSPTPQQSGSTQPDVIGDDDLINADRPGLADSSSVVGAKRLQIESGIQLEFSRPPGIREHTLFIPTLLRIGISSRWEARIEGNTFTRTSDFEVTGTTKRFSGLAPISLGFKYNIQDSEGVRHPSLGAIVRIFPKWGKSDFRAHHLTGDLRLSADWDFAPKLSLNPNVGVGLYEDGRGNAFAAGLFAITLNYLPSKRLNPFIDLGLQAPQEKKGLTSVIVDAGVAYIVGRNLQLDVSIGAGARGLIPSYRFISCGVSFRSNVARHGK